MRIALKKRFADGTVAVDLDPLSLITRLAASVPPPRMHTIRYAGVLASRSRFRARIVKKPVEVVGGEAPKYRRRHIPYAELMRRTFRIDVETCHDCGGKMKLLALVKEPASITRFLRHLGLPTEAPARAPPRDEPYWQSVVMRRKAHDGQMEMFAA